MRTESWTPRTRRQLNVYKRTGRMVLKEYERWDLCMHRFNSWDIRANPLFAVCVNAGMPARRIGMVIRLTFP